MASSLLLVHLWNPPSVDREPRFLLKRVAPHVLFLFGPLPLPAFFLPNGESPLPLPPCRRTTRLASFPDLLVLHMRKYVVEPGSWTAKKLGKRMK